MGPMWRPRPSRAGIEALDEPGPRRPARAMDRHSTCRPGECGVQGQLGPVVAADHETSERDLPTRMKIRCLEFKGVVSPAGFETCTHLPCAVAKLARFLRFLSHAERQCCETRSLFVANHVRYIRRRNNGMFYYERRVPQAVKDRDDEWRRHFGSASLFRKSLGTRDQLQALRAGEGVHEEFELRFRRALGGSELAPENNDGGKRPVTPAILAKIAADVRASVIRPWARRVIFAELGGVHAEELEHEVEQREWDAQEMRPILMDRETSSDPRMPDVQEHAEAIIFEEQLLAPEGGSDRAFVVRAVRDGLLAGHQHVDDILSGKAAALPEKPLTQAPVAPKLSEVVREYTATLRAQRTIREAEGALNSFVSVIGDLPLNEISRESFRAFCRAEGGRIIGGKGNGSISRPISAETLKKKVALIRSAINKAIDTGRFEGPNPAVAINSRQFTTRVSKAVMPDKRPFDVHEMRLILLHPWFTGCRSETETHEPGLHRLRGAQFWVPLLAMHTGCRAGELGGLRLSEVRLDHEHPHLVIQDNDYRTTKGSYRRKIPLLDVVLEHGLREYVKRLVQEGHDRLFPDWKAPAGIIDASSTAWSNASIIRSFNRTVVKQQLRSLLAPDARQEVTFHSFRGAFKTLLGRSEYSLPPNYIHEVVGHAKSALDKRYIVEIPLADTYPVIRGCRYQGLEPFVIMRAHTRHDEGSFDIRRAGTDRRAGRCGPRGRRGCSRPPFAAAA